jgi:hypothetical protein
MAASSKCKSRLRSKSVVPGDGALFAALQHELRNNYWFVFYSERLDTMWVMSSAEFIAESVQNKSGKNVGKRSIWFNGKKANRVTGEKEEYVKERYKKYVCRDFSRLLEP